MNFELQHKSNSRFFFFFLSLTVRKFLIVKDAVDRVFHLSTAVLFSHDIPWGSKMSLSQSIFFSTDRTNVQML